MRRNIRVKVSVQLATVIVMTGSPPTALPALMQEKAMVTSPHNDQQTAAGDPPGDQQQEISAVVPGRLAPQVPPGTVETLRQQDWWSAASRVASDWQTTSAYAHFWEVALVPRVQPGRVNELVGLIAAGGEQLGLALAGVVEAELWNIFRRDHPPDPGTFRGRVLVAAQEMTQRAMADSATYYLLATGHTVANVTARALALDTQLHPLLLDALGTWCPVGSQDAQDWLSLNRDSVRRLRRVAKTAAVPELRMLGQPTSALLLSPDWRELDQLRGAH